LETNEKAGDEIVARLKLDIKALTLLFESDADLKPVVERSFIESQDGYMVRFMGLLQSRRSTNSNDGSFPIALGEIILAAFLTILGLATFVPVTAGVSEPQQWMNYFSSALAPTFTNGPLYRGISLVNFLFAAALLLGAFYSLRRAGRSLKSAGMVPESGRS